MADAEHSWKRIVPLVMTLRLDRAARIIVSPTNIVVMAILSGSPTPSLSAPAKPQQKSCKIVSAELVFFGQETTRNDTIKRLDRAVIDWRSKPGNEKAKEVKRTVACELAIPLLNEYHCKAEATLCK